MIDIHIQIAPYVVKTFMALGSCLGGFIFVLLLWKTYQKFDTARHSYMAQAIQEVEHEVLIVRERNDDWEDVEPYVEPFPSKRWNYRLVTWLLDFVYRPTTMMPEREYKTRSHYRRKRNV